MTSELEPSVGQWYLRHDKGQVFRVVAVDPTGTGIEIQSFDGDLEELDSDTWHEIVVAAVAAPEDCTGPYDDLEAEDLGYTETAMTHRDWRVALESLPPPPEAWLDTVAVDEA